MTTADGLITGLFSVAGVALGSYLQKRKQNADAAKVEAEADGQELDNVRKAILIWQDLAERETKRCLELEGRVIKLTEQVKWLEGELTTVLRQYNEVKNNIGYEANANMNKEQNL